MCQPITSQEETNIGIAWIAETTYLFEVDIVWKGLLGVPEKFGIQP
jgi:hypothetical protein